MRIAICDDEQVFIDQICTRINNISKTRNIDCQIQTFTTGETLLEACKKDGFDAVFLDIAMPDIDGFEVAKKLSKLSPDINLIFVSSKESLVFSSYEYSPLGTIWGRTFFGNYMVDKVFQLYNPGSSGYGRRVSAYAYAFHNYYGTVRK